MDSRLIEKLNERLDAITELWLSDLVSDGEYHRQRANLMARIERLERQDGQGSHLNGRGGC